MNTRNFITQEGLAQLTSELSDLKSKRERLIVQIEEVAQPDESGEDVLAVQLKEELEVVNDKIDNIEEALENSEVVNGQISRDTVDVGTKVTIKISGNSSKVFHIVGQLEANPALNKISDQSPLGQALLGKKVNDEIEVTAPVGKITYKIVSID